VRSVSHSPLEDLGMDGLLGKDLSGRDAFLKRRRVNRKQTRPLPWGLNKYKGAPSRGGGKEEKWEI